jgi:hypothetical protein
MPVARSQKTENQRESFRCPVAGQREAELVVGESRVPVVLEDESATGFGVTTRKSLGVRQGDVVQLRTSAGCFEVRVVRFARAEAAAADEHQKNAKGPALRLGLERIRDLTETRAPAPRSVRWRDIFFPPWILPSRTPTLIVGIFLLLLVAIVPVGVILYLRAPDWPIFQRVSLQRLTGWFRQLDGNASSQSPPSADPAGSSRLASGRPGDGADPPPLLIPESLFSTADRLIGRETGIAPKALRDLNLTPGQQRKLQQLLEQIAEALRLLDSRRAQLSDEEQARVQRKLVEAARVQALDLLTEEQQAAWKALSAPPAADKKSAAAASPGGNSDASKL